MKLRSSVWALLVVISIAGGCGGDDADPAPSPSAIATAIPASSTTQPPTPQPSRTTVAPAGEPIGYPLDPDLITDGVIGEVGARVVAPGAGAAVSKVSRDWQTLDIPDAANRYGWNCRTHVEYEAAPAVDWYVPAGTPVYATMEGTATLFINTYANAFDYYEVDREPYIGNPVRARAAGGGRAPIVPFPGPSGGMGVYVSITSTGPASAGYRTDYVHLSLDATLANVPPDVFVGDFDYAEEFAAPRTLDVTVASWPVRRGDVIGYTGDAGYSEAPHLHYQIIRLSDGAQLCPTSEAGFVDGEWLAR